MASKHHKCEEFASKYIFITSYCAVLDSVLFGRDGIVMPAASVLAFRVDGAHFFAMMFGDYKTGNILIETSLSSFSSPSLSVLIIKLNFVVHTFRLCPRWDFVIARFKHAGHISLVYLSASFSVRTDKFWVGLI